ncbi:unnamed protein product [Arctogadus glacialis]
MPCVHGLLTPVQLRSRRSQARRRSHAPDPRRRRKERREEENFVLWTRQCHFGASILVIKSRAGSALCSVYSGTGPETFTGDGPVEPARPLRPQCNHLPIVMIAVREEMRDEMDAPFL